jgi:hypothetical protein
LRGSTPAPSTPLVTISALLTSTAGGLDKPTTDRSRLEIKYVVDGCLNSSGVLSFLAVTVSAS